MSAERERVRMYERPIDPPVFSVPITAPPTLDEIMEEISILQRELRQERMHRRRINRRVTDLEMQTHSHIH
jgi:hypothetical protein